MQIRKGFLPLRSQNEREKREGRKLKGGRREAERQSIRKRFLNDKNEKLSRKAKHIGVRDGSTDKVLLRNRKSCNVAESFGELKGRAI